MESTFTMESTADAKGSVPLESTADSEELNIVSEEELRQQQFARHESQSSRMMVPPLHSESPDEPDIDGIERDLNGRDDNMSVLRVSAEGETDLLGRPLRPYITPLTRPVRTHPQPTFPRVCV